ncbi:unnamed protein product [Rotaria magnacalcarata]|uniref:F-box domain-containing protein n=1 Tax=Rotaria magnacalcarata TaxID=392030 RepID=A0A815D3H5_9BILA|nr:unnamed protein product [Rotaria magnacalcarata]CAF1610363.1 unnamed protein product [Rotaria magnacalcarata]CAF2111246.1 unnamed protein product [Rotaria magnacalcarata]CAF3991911.1 unnamed protein product [Rotaria magnacalcarata]CAF4018670.1 unnamed protein product [Rotaria magnacalcarata]
MDQCNIHLLDLPNEILFCILKKLGNVDVLYFLFGIKNQRINALIEDYVFTNILNFVKTSITDDKLDRFCTYILLQKHSYIRKLILDATYMKRILHAGNYPNLTYLEIFNFTQEIGFPNFTTFRHILQHQITDLILHNNDEYCLGKSMKIYNRNIYAHIMDLFENLKHLSIVASSVNEYPFLHLWDWPSAAYFASTLTILCINVFCFKDCLSLLDGRLKQLTTFKVQFHGMFKHMLTSPNIGDLHNLKCFSLTSYDVIWDRHDIVVALLRSMNHLEKLTLYLLIGKDKTFHCDTSPYVDGTYLQNEVLVHMTQLQAFNFYISTENPFNHTVFHISSDDIQQTFTNIKYGETACILDYIDGTRNICHVYSLPFTFTHLKNITTHFPFIVFDTVTHVSAFDSVPFEHEFFMRISQAFPLLKCFSVQNWQWQHGSCDENPLYLVIEFTHLISLDITRAHKSYIEQFLLETKTRLPCLTHLKVDYRDLKDVTKNFTRDATRHNCSKVNRLIVGESTTFSKDFSQYFPSL